MSITDARLRLCTPPAGWFAVAFSRDLTVGAELQRTVSGRSLRVTRDRAGTPVVIDTDRRRGAGAGVGGTTMPVHEHCGAVLVYHDPADPHAAPPWQVAPVEAVHEERNWSAPVDRIWTIRVHAAEIIENTVDTGHFTSVHGYRGLEVVAPLACDGPHLRMGYIATREQGLFGRWDPIKLSVRLDILASGIGFSRVQVHDRLFGMRLRFVVMPTPIDAEHVEVRVCSQISMPAIPVLRAKLAERIADEMGRDFEQDIRIWENKRYVAKPCLVAEDGPIPAYRRWTQQFYTAEHSRVAARAAVHGVAA